MQLFSGLSAFPITPADTSGRVDADQFGALVERLVVSRADSIGVLGSTGGYAYLTRAERLRATTVAVERARGRKPIMVGVGALRTDEAIALAGDAQKAGADGLLLAPMSYTPLFDHEVHAHFTAVAASVDLPICIYNNPTATHFSFSFDLIGRLAQLPNIVAIKNPAPAAGDVPAHLAALRSQVPLDFSLGYSVDFHAAGALLAGGRCWYSVLAGTFPTPCAAIRDAAIAGDAERARSLSARLEPVWQLMRMLGGLRVVYALARSAGLCDAEPPLPIMALTGDALLRAQEVLKETEVADEASWT